jgi:hypothetical protein
MSASVSGLRVYVKAPEVIAANEAPVVEQGAKTIKTFYSRRGNGPFYRWLYEEKLALWRSLRMNTSDFDSHKLSNTSWKSVPETLQTQLGAHYLD